MMKRFVLVNLLGGVVAGLILVVFLGLVTAQEGGGRIAVTPLTFEFTAERGQSDGDFIRVMNSSFDDDVRVRMEVEDMFPEGEEGRVVLQSPEEDLESIAISRWVRFDPEEFTLEPREERRVRFTIEVPEDASPGGHYAGLIASSADPIGPGAVGVVQRIASLVLLTVPGEMEESLSVIDFGTATDYYDRGPATFVTRFENSGTVHLRPDAEIEIVDIFGREVDTVQVEKRNILPGAVRRIETDWDRDWLLGIRYTANLTGTYGEDGSLNSVSTSFWAFPWRLGIALLALLLFFFVTRKRWISVFKILVFGEKGLSK